MREDLEKVVQQFNEIFIEILDEPDMKLTTQTTADDVDEWDSLTHILLVVAIEKHFKVKFTSMELDKFSNVGEMSESVLQKLNT